MKLLVFILILAGVAMGIKPKGKPEYTRAESEKTLTEKNVVIDKVVLLAFRGYYSKTFYPAGNNIGVYDDALIMISPDHYSTYNFNVDPSSQAKGRANLCAGIWQFELGIHNRSKAKSRQYKALIQDEAEFLIHRYGEGTKLETYRGINLHRGSNTTTSSLGCLTIPPDQWDSFIETVEDQMDKYKQKKVQVVLLDL